MDDITDKELDKFSGLDYKSELGAHQLATDYLEKQKTQKAPYQELFEKVFGVECKYDDKEKAIVGKYVDEESGASAEFFYQSKAMSHLSFIDDDDVGSIGGNFSIHNYVKINGTVIGWPIVDLSPSILPDYNASEHMERIRDQYLNEFDENIKKIHKRREFAGEKLEELISLMREEKSK